MQALALGQVANRAQEADPLGHLDGRKRYLQRESITSLAPAPQFDCAADDPGFPRLQIALESSSMGLAIFLGHQHRQRLTDDLALRVAEHPLGGGVEEGDHSLLIAHHDGITRLFRELPVARLGSSQRLFSTFTLGDLLHKPLVLSADRGLSQGGHDVPAELGGKPRRDRTAGQHVNAERGVHLKRINLGIGS